MICAEYHIQSSVASLMSGAACGRNPGYLSACLIFNTGAVPASRFALFGGVQVGAALGDVVGPVAGGLAGPSDSGASVDAQQVGQNAGG